MYRNAFIDFDTQKKMWVVEVTRKRDGKTVYLDGPCERRAIRKAMLINRLATY
jgi:hypothetical protein